MKYARIVAEFYSRVWALREETLLAMQELLRLQAFECVKWSAEEIRERIANANALNGYVPIERGGARYVAFDQELEMQAASGKRNAAVKGSVAVIPIVGIISNRMSMLDDISGPGGASVQKMTMQFRQAMEDTNCKAIVFDVDSPGGSVEGVMELATEIFNGRKQKPITAVSNSMACSAAYWLSSAASELVCTPSGQCGSIGVYMIHSDESKALENEGVKLTLIKAGKYKAEGGPSEPLSAEARAAFQSKVDDYYGMFVKAVAQNRGATQAAVRDGFGQGRSLLASAAVKEHLADRVATLDDVLREHGVKTSASGSALSSQALEQDAQNKFQPFTLFSDPMTNQITVTGVAAPNHITVNFPPIALIARTKPDPDDDEDDDNLCGCNCSACQACEKKGGARADDGDMSCKCACNACQACDFKSDAKSEKSKDAVVADALRIRRFQLDSMR
jgi:signal peptide peptidase SppA